MPVIQVPTTVQPRQIEFDGVEERSKPGALYFTPGAVKTITDAEFDYLKRHHKRFSNLLTVLPVSDKKSRLEIKKEGEAKKTEVAPEKKRPKDVVSKSKQRAKALLEKATNPDKAEEKPVPKPSTPTFKQSTTSSSTNVSSSVVEETSTSDKKASKDDEDDSKKKKK
jgi:hypothetical protein